MSDMVHQFQIDGNRIRRQLKSASLQVGLDEIDGPCQKIFFKAKILIEVDKQLQNVTK